MSPAAIRTKPEPSCPGCGARMVLRRSKPGQSWEPFWGCNRFPNCHAVLHIDPETGEPESDFEDWAQVTEAARLLDEARKVEGA